jgi:hypothetical protein
MIMIDSNTTRDELLSVIYSTGELLDMFVDGDKDPEFMETEEVRSMVIDWIEAGNEAMGG